jgi:hypothetical protein
MGLLKGVRVHWISISYRKKIFRVYDHSSLLQDSIGSLGSGYLHVPDEVGFVSLHISLSCMYELLFG